jgi:hypothetical protein
MAMSAHQAAMHFVGRTNLYNWTRTKYLLAQARCIRDGEPLDVPEDLERLAREVELAREAFHLARQAERATEGLGAGG